MRIKLISPRLGWLVTKESKDELWFSSKKVPQSFLQSTANLWSNNNLLFEVFFYCGVCLLALLLFGDWFLESNPKSFSSSCKQEWVNWCGGGVRARGRSMRVRHSDPYRPLPHLHPPPPSSVPSTFHCTDGRTPRHPCPPVQQHHPPSPRWNFTNTHWAIHPWQWIANASLAVPTFTVALGRFRNWSD